MTRIHVTLETAVPAEQVLAAATDFSERRPDVWPNISRRFYTVHEIGETWAEVTEGSNTMGGIWARERYEWSTPGVVRAVVQDSNVFRTGGTWEMRVYPTESGGSHIEFARARRGAGLKGRVIEAMLTIAGRKVLSDGLQQTLQRLTNGAAADRELGLARG